MLSSIMQVFTQSVRRLRALLAARPVPLALLGPFTIQTVRWLGAALAALTVPAALIGIFALQGLGSQSAWEQTLYITTALTWAVAAPLAVYAFIKRQETRVVAAFAGAAAALSLLNAALLLAGVIKQGDYLIPLALSAPFLLYLLWAWLPFRHGGGGARPAAEQ